MDIASIAEVEKCVVRIYDLSLLVNNDKLSSPPLCILILTPE